MDNCKDCIWSGKCATEGSGLNCNEFTAKAQKPRMKTHIVAYREPRRKERDQGVMILCRNAGGKVRTFRDSDDARHAAGALGVVETAMTEEELNRENEKRRDR